MPCFASSLLDSNRRQRALQISAGPIGQGDYYQPVRCLVLVYAYLAYYPQNSKKTNKISYQKLR